MSDEQGENNPPVYIEGYLHKKEERNKWVEFWVVLEGRFLKFQRHKLENENIGNRLIGWIELTKEAKCFMGRKKDYSFPFYIKKRGKKYLFKTSCTLSRHRWVKAIELSIQGKSPRSIPRGLSEISRNCSIASSSSDEISEIDAVDDSTGGNIPKNQKTQDDKLMQPTDDLSLPNGQPTDVLLLPNGQSTHVPSLSNGQTTDVVSLPNAGKSIETPSTMYHHEGRSSSLGNIIDLEHEAVSVPVSTFPRLKGALEGLSVNIADMASLTSKREKDVEKTPITSRKDEDSFRQEQNVEIANSFTSYKTSLQNSGFGKAFKSFESSSFTNKISNETFRLLKNEPLSSSNTPVPDVKGVCNLSVVTWAESAENDSKSSKMLREYEESDLLTDIPCTLAIPKNGQKEPVAEIIDAAVGCKTKMAKKISFPEKSLDVRSAGSVASPNSSIRSSQKCHKSATFTPADKVAVREENEKRRLLSKRGKGQKLHKSASCSQADKGLVSKAREATTYSKIPSCKKENGRKKVTPSTGSTILQSKADEKKNYQVYKNTNDITASSTLARNGKSRNNESQLSSSKDQGANVEKSRTYVRPQSANKSSIPIPSNKTAKAPDAGIAKSPRSILGNSRNQFKVVGSLKDELHKAKNTDIRRPGKYRKDTSALLAVQNTEYEDSLCSTYTKSSRRTPSLQGCRRSDENSTAMSSCSSGRGRPKCWKDTDTILSSKRLQKEKKVKFPKTTLNRSPKGEDISSMEATERILEKDTKFKTSSSSTNSDQKSQQTPSKSNLCRKASCHRKKGSYLKSKNLVPFNGETDLPLTTILDEVRQGSTFCTAEKVLLSKYDKREEHLLSSSGGKTNIDHKTTSPSPLTEKDLFESDIGKNKVYSSSALSDCIDLRKGTSTSSLDTIFISGKEEVSECPKTMENDFYVGNEYDPQQEDLKSFLGLLDSDADHIYSSTPPPSSKILISGEKEEIDNIDLLSDNNESDHSLEPGEVLMSEINNDYASSNLNSIYNWPNVSQHSTVDPIPISKSDKTVEFAHRELYLQANNNQSPEIPEEYPNSEEIGHLYRSSSFSAADKRTILKRPPKNVENTITRNQPPNVGLELDYTNTLPDKPPRLRSRSLSTSKRMRPFADHGGKSFVEDKYCKAYSQSVPATERISRSVIGLEENNIHHVQPYSIPTRKMKLLASDEQPDTLTNMGSTTRNAVRYFTQNELGTQPESYSWEESSNIPDKTQLRYTSPAGKMVISEIDECDVNHNIIPPSLERHVVGSDVGHVRAYSFSGTRSHREPHAYSSSASASVAKLPTSKSHQSLSSPLETANNTHHSPASSSTERMIYSQSCLPDGYSKSNFIVPQNPNNRFPSPADGKILITISNEPSKLVSATEANNTNQETMTSSSSSPEESTLVSHVGSAVESSSISSNDIINRLTPIGEASSASNVSEIRGKKNGNNSEQYALSDRLKEILIQGDKFGSMTYLNCDVSKHGIVGTPKEKGGIFNKLFLKTKQNMKKENCFSYIE